ncbi:MAG: hypothetical protein QN152_13535 [Armatimonadota bacterium]|nr:hypothetical protein [Armatimonadota bacterium]MDR7427276.1 hypothetical protein [Armatimonadota bacterium]MDR7463150.1 hypothetical protein [Armatimonadota bacterium]MDR7468863.1 hypothetical protein [Armatimonadota bacterium]MDR7474896.1 hypothetical protein [Armatimonadota bacterium]
MPEERELTPQEKIAAARARVEALKAQRAAQAAAGAPAASTTTPGKHLDVFVSAANAAGRPVERVQGRTVRACGTVNQAVDIVAAPEDADNLKKLLAGISGYQNPLRRGTFQVDYRYYQEARRRLEAAGYTVEENDFMDRPLAAWTPQTRGWTRVEGA